jgi:hypothetical protein
VQGAQGPTGPRSPDEEPPAWRLFFLIGVTEFAEAAKREIGEALLRDPVRVACPSCGSFVVNVFVTPNLIRGRCTRCRVDILALVSKEREVLAVTEK